VEIGNTYKDRDRERDRDRDRDRDKDRDRDSAVLHLNKVTQPYHARTRRQYSTSN